MRSFRPSLFLAACFLVHAGSRSGSRYPERRDRPRVCQARRRAAATAGSRAAQDHPRPGFSGTRAGLSGRRETCPAAPATRRRSGSPTSLKSTKDETRLPKPRIAATQVSIAVRPVLRIVRGRRSRTSPGRNSPTARTSSGTRYCSMCCSSTRFTPIAPAFRSAPGSSGWPSAWSLCFGFSPPGGAVRAYEFTGDPGVVPLDPRWHQAALRFVEAGLLPHPRRDRPPVVSALPGDPAAALAHR